MRRTSLASLSVILPLLAASTSYAAEPWQVSSRSDESTGAQTSLASVVNDEAFRLVVERRAAGAARCALHLPEGSSDTLAPDRLPELIIDAFPPQRVVAWPEEANRAEDGGDFMEVARRSVGAAPLIGVEAHRVRFECWTPLRDQSSPTRGIVRQLMDGEQLLVRYPVVEGGTAETSFSLEAARTAIAQALDIAEAPSETDLLQDDLLRFRIQYRSSTCYLLGHKKRWKTCLEAVNRCAAQAHDSVIAMIGCIEIE